VLINQHHVIVNYSDFGNKLSIDYQHRKHERCRMYCHSSIGIDISNTLLPKYCYWYWQ